LIVSGSINTISNKLQNITVSLGQKYNHSFFITFVMFCGEAICLLVYYLKKNRNNNPIRNQNGEQDNLVVISEKQNLPPQKPELSPYMLMLPAFCDFLSSTVNTIGLTMMTGSSFQMMRGASILFVALFSKMFLKSKLFVHNYIALTLIIFGLGLVGAANLVLEPSIPRMCSTLEATTTSVLGFALIFFGSIFVAFQFIIEEEFIKKYNVHPLEIVGWEGVWGALFYIPVLIVFQNIQCPNPVAGKESWTKVLCTRNDKNEWILEDSHFAIRQNMNDSSLLFCNIAYCLSIALFNFTGVTVTKIASAASRAVTDTIRTVVIWCFFMLPIVSICNREHFNFVQLTGFLFLIGGTLIYNEIIQLPLFGKKTENVEDEKKERKGSEEALNYDTIPLDAIPSSGNKNV
jgi:drug/metabolite transporter (DMT)-like permease